MNCNNTKYLFLNFKFLMKPSKIVFLEKYHPVEALIKPPKNSWRGRYVLTERKTYNAVD